MNITYNQIQEKGKLIKRILERNDNNFSTVVPESLFERPPLLMDFTENNVDLSKVDLKNTEDFNRFVFSAIEIAGASVGVGGYGEDRIIYRRSSLFEGEEPRSIHLAVDIWAQAGTPIYTPLGSKVHSFQDNDNFGDFGPTIILEHQLQGENFYTLYGHLSRASIKNLKVGQEFRAGEKIAEFGNYPENGNWPPHLHFQIMADMLDKSGDFVAVAKPSEKEYYLDLCPDPNLILQVPELG